VSYEDYPIPADNFPACGSGYVPDFGGYGRPDRDDRAFEDVLRLTPDVRSVVCAIRDLSNKDGGDFPQSYGRVYWEVAESVLKTPGSGYTNLGFLDDSSRDSLKILVDFGDDVPHDTDLNHDDGNNGNLQKYEIWGPNRLLNGTYLDIGGGEIDSGVDPGRPGDPPPNTTGVAGDFSCPDDVDIIDFQDRALPALEATGIRLVHIDSSERTELIPYWTTWTSGTGGAFARLRSNGDPIDVNLPELIEDLIKTVVNQPVATSSP
jgi:hypothetical protein